MCYSPEVSFTTWTIGIISSIYLFYQGKPFIFPLVVSQMQLVEGLRWINIIDEKIIAILAKIVLFLQPVAAFVEAGKYSYILPYVLAQTAATAAAGSRDFRFIVADDGHFEWKWITNVFSIETIPYWVGLVVGSSLIFSHGIGLLLLAFLAYFYINHKEYNTFGSLWCFSVNIMWIYYIFIK